MSADFVRDVPLPFCLTSRLQYFEIMTYAIKNLLISLKLLRKLDFGRLNYFYNTILNISLKQNFRLIVDFRESESELNSTVNSNPEDAF